MNFCWKWRKQVYLFPTDGLMLKILQQMNNVSICHIIFNRFSIIYIRVVPRENKHDGTLRSFPYQRDRGIEAR